MKAKPRLEEDPELASALLCETLCGLSGSAFSLNNRGGTQRTPSATLLLPSVV